MRISYWVALKSKICRAYSEERSSYSGVHTRETEGLSDEAPRDPGHLPVRHSLWYIALRFPFFLSSSSVLDFLMFICSYSQQVCLLWHVGTDSETVIALEDARDFYVAVSVQLCVH